MSSPGSGKTTLLEETIKQLKGRKPVYVIEGDQQTSNDADRIAALDVPVFQVNTGTGCHLEASMIHHALKHLNPTDNSILFIENVGNLVCPAMFDLGEAQKVVIVSTTEGDDKPLKYPQMFQEANICIINKIDLSPYLNTDINVLRENCLKVNHDLQIFEVSALKNAGMDAWCNWLIEN
jgi:hydrogenase nickel incorporation protein HypB